MKPQIPMLMLMILTGHFPCVGHAAEIIGVSKAIDYSLKHDDRLFESQEKNLQSDEDYSQAKGAFLPTVDAIGIYSKQEDIQSAANPPTSKVAKLSAKQPLFKGTREYAGLKEIGALRESKYHDTAAMRRQVALETAQAAYQVLTGDSQLVDVKNELQLYQKRYEEISGRVAIGRSRSTDLLAVQSALQTSEARRLEISASLNSAREKLMRLTGQDKDFVVFDDFDPKELLPIQDYLGSIQSLPDLDSKRALRDASEQRASGAWGSHLPNLDLAGNYYLYRTGVLKNVDWDAALTLTIPIFYGGILSSKLKSAQSDVRISEREVSKLQADLESKVKTLYAQCQSDVQRLAALQKAAEYSDRSYEQYSKDFRLGLVNHLEVLQAMATYLDSKRNLDQAKIESKERRFELELSSGRKGI